MKEILKKTLFILTLIMATLVLDVSAATNAPATLQAGSSTRVIGPYDGLYTYFGIKTYMENGSEKPAYCINDLSKSAPHNTTLKKAQELDAGYLYLIKNGYPNKSITGNADKDYYITQNAVWWYTDSIGGHTGLGSSYKNSSTSTAQHSKRLVDGALSARSKGYAKPSLKANSSSVKLTKTSDGKYYQSELVSVSASSVSGKYTVRLLNAPEGTKIVDASGNEKTTFATSEKFRVKVEASKLSELSYNFTATITATGSVEKAYRYDPSNTSAYQTILITRTYVETTPLSTSVKFSLTSSKVKLSKQDITNKKELPGATLVIKDAARNVKYTWVSTNEPVYIDTLPEGKYTLTETKAPEGYELSTEEVTFTVVAGKITPVVMYNAPEKVTMVKISKQDITTKKELPGATLIIKDAKGNIKEEWVSTNEPKYIAKLPAGKYFLIEKSAPEGYELSTETIEFEVKNNGEITSVVMYNTPKKTVVPEKTKEEEVEVPITDTNISPIVYVAGFTVLVAGSYMVIRYSKKENK